VSRSTGRKKHLMSADPDRALLATSLVFAGAAVVGSAVAIREDLPGQPCGVSVPLSVPAGLLVGWGAGVAAPWPMPAAAVIAAARSQRTRPHALTGAVCAGIGIGCVLGTAIEPVTRRPRSWSAATRLAIAFNIAASAALTMTGLRHRAAAKALRLLNQANQQRLTGHSVARQPVRVLKISGLLRAAPRSPAVITGKQPNRLICAFTGRTLSKGRDEMVSYLPPRHRDR
jgi:hypothetical protein